MHLLVVLQTHSIGDNQHYEKCTEEKRFTNTSKAEITRRCSRSLVESMNYAKELLVDSDFELVVYDDHSDDQTIDEIKNNLNISTFKTQFISLDTHGIMPSILKCYQHGRDFGKHIVYFAQDDYLYDREAILKMISTLMETTVRLNSYSSIFPFDDPYRYIPENTIVKSHLIRHEGLHWRTQNAVSSCFMVHHEMLIKEWDLFEAMGNHKVDKSMEDDTINKLWNERGYYLFVPIPSLALHMQYSTELDDQIDWASKWKKFERQEKILPTVDKTILNIGFGGVELKDSLFTDDLPSYREITLDHNPKYSPDLNIDINDLSHIPNQYVDIVYLSHVLEHFHFFEVPILIKELLRITKPNGFVRVIVPNLKYVSNSLITGKLLNTLYESPSGPVSSMDVLFGHRHSTFRDNNTYMIHKCGFTEEVFANISKEYNFNLKIKTYDLDLVVDILP
jgi:glycosyltransferase involved in cell wall biosynthesis